MCQAEGGRGPPAHVYVVRVSVLGRHGRLFSVIVTPPIGRIDNEQVCLRVLKYVNV
jgi:hypothetical protein